MHRSNGNQHNQSRSRLAQNVANDDDSRSQIDSDTSEEDQEPSTEEERSPFVPLGDNHDAEDYVKRLQKTGTADDIARSAVNQGMGMIAVKAGAAYMTRLGLTMGKGDANDIVDDDDIIGGGTAAVTKLNPSQQQMMNQMAPQASGAAAGGIAAPMMTVVVPTPIGSALASSAASTTAAASQAAVVAATAATVAAAASVAASGMFAPPEKLFPGSLRNGTIPGTYIHPSGRGIKREFLPLLERSFEEAYADMFRDTIVAASFAECLDQLESADMDCLVVCNNPEWCCELISPGVVECPFGCSFLRNGGISVFEIGGALAYEVN